MQNIWHKNNKNINFFLIIHSRKKIKLHKHHTIFNFKKYKKDINFKFLPQKAKKVNKLTIIKRKRTKGYKKSHKCICNVQLRSMKKLTQNSIMHTEKVTNKIGSNKKQNSWHHNAVCDKITRITRFYNVILILLGAKAFKSGNYAVNVMKGEGRKRR